MTTLFLYALVTVAAFPDAVIAWSALNICGTESEVSIMYAPVPSVPANTCAAVMPVMLVPTPALGVPMSGVVRVMPAKVKAAELLFKATEVVPM